MAVFNFEENAFQKSINSKLKNKKARVTPQVTPAIIKYELNKDSCDGC